MSDETTDLVQRATFGVEVEDWLQNHPIGRYVRRRMDEQTEAAMQALTEVDPEDAKAVRKLQNDYRVAKNIDRFLAEVIQEGWQAEAALQVQREDQHG